jgi:DNA-binding CsgD family transcriptional regulator
LALLWVSLMFLYIYNDYFSLYTPGTIADMTAEQQVMGLVVRGKLNKQVGGELGISEITVKAHRGKAMHKMHARSLADLVRMADVLGIYRDVTTGGNDGTPQALPRNASSQPGGLR